MSATADSPGCSRRAALATLAGLFAAPVRSHELQANRLSLVLREPRHLALNFHIDYVQALLTESAAGRAPQEVLLHLVSLPLPALERELQRAHRSFEVATRLQASGGPALAATGWTWPPTARVQALLQERVMQAVVAAGEHVHAAPVEVQAEVLAAQPLRRLQLRTPAAFGAVLVVWYRPQQGWSSAAEPLSIDFAP